MPKLPQRIAASKPIVVSLILVIVVLVAVGAFFLGDEHGVESMTIQRISPAQAASAMQGDHFYSDYRENTLLISGTVASVSQNAGDTVVTFKTSSAFKARCNLVKPAPTIHQGQTITVLSEGAIVERQSSAVLLTDCLVLN